MMGCLLSSFQGKSLQLQVQSMMVNDINSQKVGPGMQLEDLVSAYYMTLFQSQFHMHACSKLRWGGTVHVT